MKEKLKKLFICLFAVCLFFTIVYFLIKTYDPSGEIIYRIQENVFYFVFLFLSIFFALFLYGNEDGKSKLIISIIFFSNFIYLVFMFLFSSVGLGPVTGMFLIGLLVLGIISNYIKNRFGHTITILCVLGIIITIFISFVPLYEEGPDTAGFENTIGKKLLTYSMANINPKMAIIQQDKIEYNLINGIQVYDFKIKGEESTILFKSDKIYQNAFGFLLLENQEIIQIYPQSAIKINKNLEIEIISGIIKYFPQNIKNFSFTGEILPSLMADQENINIVFDRYNKELNDYITNQIGLDILENKTLSNMSKFLLEFLYKIYPRRFKKNIANFESFQKHIDKEYENVGYKDVFDKKEIQKSIIKKVQDGLDSTEIIK